MEGKRLCQVCVQLKENNLFSNLSGDGKQGKNSSFETFFFCSKNCFYARNEMTAGNSLVMVFWRFSLQFAASILRQAWGQRAVTSQGSPLMEGFYSIFLNQKKTKNNWCYHQKDGQNQQKPDLLFWSCISDASVQKSQTNSEDGGRFTYLMFWFVKCVFSLDINL